MEKKTLIVPAAGSGSRLNTETPKPFIKMSGKTILEHSLRSFLSLEGLTTVIVPTSEQYISKVEKLLDTLLPKSITGKVIPGGNERQDSIFKASKEIDETDLVIVHDAVRPFVTLSQVEACCKVAGDVGGAVLGVPVQDTIKRVDSEQHIKNTPDRRVLWQAQTPQVFHSSIFVEACRKAREENFVGTDDASLVERLGYEVKMVEGNKANIKITYPLDLKLAELLFEVKNE